VAAESVALDLELLHAVAADAAARREERLAADGVPRLPRGELERLAAARLVLLDERLRAVEEPLRDRADLDLLADVVVVEDLLRVVARGRLRLVLLFLGRDVVVE